MEKSLLDFVESNKENTDIFTFLEASQGINTKFKSILNNFVHTESHEKISEDVWFDISVFVKNKIKNIVFSPNLIKDRSAGNLILVEGAKFNVLVVHGVHIPTNKLDTLERISFSKKIIRIASKSEKPIIIGGDFNLMPETKSIEAFSKNGFINLIKQFRIKSTRNNLAWNFFKDRPGFVKQYFADYCFVSKDIQVKSFEVPDIEVSDHLPLILEFEV